MCLSNCLISIYKVCFQDILDLQNSINKLNNIFVLSEIKAMKRKTIKIKKISSAQTRKISSARTAQIKCVRVVRADDRSVRVNVPSAKKAMMQAMKNRVMQHS